MPDNRNTKEILKGTSQPLLNGLDYSLRRYFVDEFYFWHVPCLTIGSLVLDLGGNKIRKRGRFNIGRYGLRVIYANLSTAKLPDVQADVSSIPFRNSCFDAVICSELLEHVPYPLLVLREAHRVLRDGGTLLVCVPFLYQIHGDPYDYGRYTDFYWREILGEAGFEITTLEKQGQFWSVLVDMVRAYVCEGISGNNLVKRLMRNAIMPGLIALGKRLAVTWDVRAQKSQNSFFSSFTTGFGIVATKQKR